MKIKIIVFALAFPFIILLVSLVFLLEIKKPSQQNPFIQPVFPTPVGSPQNSANNNSQFHTAKPFIPYVPGSGEKFLNALQNRQTLSSSDQSVKETLIDPLSGQPGVLYKSNNVEIDYLPAADDFQVEIDTPNVSVAKQEAISWMEGQGMSQQGLCILPLNFYLALSTQDLQQLQQNGTRFNPLPDYCQ